MRISMIGCGHVGAAHAVSMAKLRREVIGIDIHRDKVELLGRARTPFFDPGFEEQPAPAGAGDRLPTADEPGCRVASALGGERQSEDSTLMST
jgi:UDP-N-acetyl-D-mannosaminuronate dehydrogenase